MIVETVYFCTDCNERYCISDDNCSECGKWLDFTKSRNVTKLLVSKWWNVFSRKYVAFYTPEKEFTSQSEFWKWQRKKVEEYKDGDYHDVFQGKTKYI